jgi:flagellar hook-length control protein FliK
MRFSVHRVVAEAPSVLPSRPHLPSARARADADASPFSDLLDSPAPEAAPAPRSARAERPDPPERADQPKAADRSDKTDAKPATDNADGKDAPDAQDAKESKDAKTASDGSDDAKSAKDAKDGKAAEATEAKHSDAAGDKPKADNDQAAALDAMFVDAATPAVIAAPQAASAPAVIQPLALATDQAEAATPEADALAALQGATGQSPRARLDATKPGQTQAGDKPTDAAAKGTAIQGATAQGAAAKGASAKGDAAAGPQAAMPEIEPGKNGDTHSNGDTQSEGNADKPFSDFHRAAAELLGKADGHAPAQSGGDAAGVVKAGADAVQNLGAPAPAHAATPATAAAAAAVAAQVQAQAPAMAVPLSGLAVEIATHADAGRNHFEIRLDPPDLGRINVKLDIDRHGNVTTHLLVDRVETLDLLKRDASSLERALQQAGLKTSDNALDFSLRQHSFAQDDTPAQAGPRVVVSDNDPAPLEALRQGYGRLLGLGGGLDIRI